MTTKAPERIVLELRSGMTDDFWSECRDPRYAKSEPVQFIRADLHAAIVAERDELRRVLQMLHHAVCDETGFAACVRADSKTAYPWPALDEADEAARAALAKQESTDE